MSKDQEDPQKKNIIGFLFGMSGRITQKQYAITGFSLMMFKYLSELLFVYLVNGTIWSLQIFVLPIASYKLKALGGNSSWMFWVMVIWSLPFLWIGITMSLRRTLDAGLPSWFSMLFLVPFVNLLFMLVMCFLPSSNSEKQPYQPDPNKSLRSALIGVGGGVVISLVMMIFTVFILKEYSSTLFFGTPLFASFFAGYFFNREESKTKSATITVTFITLVISAGALLLFAFEGIICLAMALPIGLVACIPGALLGRAVAITGRSKLSHIALVLLSLPLLAAVSPEANKLELREVQTSVVINAPPKTVWKNVVTFTELPKPHRFIFHLGIAYPIRARIKGKGVGAIRHCEFSTGPFVEPITRWEEPTRLSFSVAKNPPTMHEWSPYRKIHAPHLNTTFFSKKGEFRLIAQPNGKTRLEGSTWYVLKIFPTTYWQVWADALIHEIHKRVLEHIKVLSEKKHKQVK